MNSLTSSDGSDAGSASEAGRGRVAIVTGGSGGIGSAVSRRLAGAGLAIVVHYAGSAKAAEAVVAEITEAGGTAVALPGDIAESVAFLAGDGGRWINGQVLYANGGIA